MEKILYENGVIIGNNIKFIKEVEKKQKQHRRALFQCHCGELFESNIVSVKSLNTKSCGCLNTPEVIAKRETIHGMYGHVVYKKWISMNERCYRKKAANYYKYGERGIKVCDSWRKNFKCFYDYISKLDNYDEKKLKENILSIDRIDNDKDYEPGNIRLTTWHYQSTNKRIQWNNTSGYKGIQYSKNTNKWKSMITVNGNKIYLGAFVNKIDAINSRLNYIKENNLYEYI